MALLAAEYGKSRTHFDLCDGLCCLSCFSDFTEHQDLSRGIIRSPAATMSKDRRAKAPALMDNDASALVETKTADAADAGAGAAAGMELWSVLRCCTKCCNRKRSAKARADAASSKLANLRATECFTGAFPDAHSRAEMSSLNAGGCDSYVLLDGVPESSERTCFTWD